MGILPKLNILYTFLIMFVYVYRAPKLFQSLMGWSDDDTIARLYQLSFCDIYVM